ncbi:MAG: hypothetical protein R3195_10065 [Gemmatimonadota bacterium]|nr:hypothetical protein [Gemmatimonadota bacterium]
MAERRPAAIAALALVAVACSESGEGTPVSAVRDSAGVTIVETTAPLWADGAGFVVDPDPVLDLTASGVGEPHEFFGVAAARRLSDGVIAVSDAGSSSIRFYGPDGALIRSIGREGEGPGEFLAVRGLERTAGDTLGVFDFRNRRLALIPPGGETVDPLPLPPERVTDLRMLPGGELLLELSGDQPGATADGGSVRFPVFFARATRDGRIADTIATGGGGETIMLADGAARPLFGKDTYSDVHDERLYVGDSDSLEVRVYTLDGDLERVIRVPGFDLHMTDALRDAEIELRVALARGTRETNERLPVPAHRPAYADLLVDSEGYVWTAEHLGWFRNLLADVPRTWQVFDPDGRWLGGVALPARFVPFEIGADYVLGLRRDDIDVEVPLVYRLHRGPLP